MQTQLLHRDPPLPLPISVADYVVALQNKSGELQALREAHARTWERLVPLVQIVGPNKREKPLSRAMPKSWIRRLAPAVGAHPFYLDLLRLKPELPVPTRDGDVPVLECLYDAARTRRLNFVPVAWLGESTSTHIRCVARAAIADGRGLAIRYRPMSVVMPPGSSAANAASALLDDLATEAVHADLIVDLGYIGPDTDVDPADVAALFEAILGVGDWRSFVMLGSSIPAAMSEIKENSVGSIERREWHLWQRLGALGLQRTPTFGDYAVQHPSPPAGGGPGMRANIRYTTDDKTIVARGHSLLEEGSEQYRTLCGRLVAQREFAGAGYSWGDDVIDDCASGELVPGSQNMWRGAGTSHHLQVVTDQLRARHGLPRSDE